MVFECVQKFNLPFAVLFEPCGDIADQIAEHSCDLGPCRIAICGVDAKIGQVAIGGIADLEKNTTARPADPARASRLLRRLFDTRIGD
jgi:hypothetical protein